MGSSGTRGRRSRCSLSRWRRTHCWTAGSGITQLTNSTGGGNNLPSINADGTRITFYSDRDLTPGSPGNADGNLEIFLATESRVDLTVSGSGPGPVLTNPVTVRYTVQGCAGQEMFLVLNAPAMGIPWSYLGFFGWVPLPTNLAEIAPFQASGPADGTYTLFAGTAPAGTYALYLGCDFVHDGHLTIDTSAGLTVNGAYDYLSATVQ
jgi:hypothetical protein